MRQCVKARLKNATVPAQRALHDSRKLVLNEDIDYEDIDYEGIDYEDIDYEITTRKCVSAQTYTDFCKSIRYQ
jgi:hypothetical protein